MFILEALVGGVAIFAFAVLLRELLNALGAE